MNPCPKCNKSFNEGVKCSKCKQSYCFECAEITEVNYRKLNVASLSKLLCEKCKVTGDTPTVPDDTISSLFVEPSILKQINASLVILPDIIKELKGEISSLQTQLSFFDTDIENLQNRVHTIETSMQQ